jgi:serine/threonine-protein kinase
VQVPDVVGRTAEEANQILTEAEFIVDQVSAESDSVEEGRVIEQNPPAGDEVPPGTTVTITVSSGTGTVAVPSVAGLSEAEARSILEAADLTVGSVQQEANGDIPAGNVIRSDPGQGAEVAPGSSVTLIVSSGPERVVVPSVEGVDESTARSQIENVGLVVQITDQQVANPGQDGVVLSQSPGSGAQANPGDTVSLVVGRFREPEVPGDDGG